MASFKTYNFPTLISGAYFNGTQFTLFSDLARTTPIDLTGFAITMAMKTAASFPPTKIFSTADGSITITDAANGVFRINGTNMNIPPAKYLFDIDFLSPTNQNKVYITGTWEILQNIT